MGGFESLLSAGEDRAMTSENFSRPGAVDLSSLAQAAAPAGGGYVTELTEAEFDQAASQSMQYPVIVEFHSPRDPNGSAVSRPLADAVNAAAGKYLLARVNVDEQPRIAQAIGVQAVPTVVAIIGGQLAPLFQGTKSPEEIAAIVDQVGQAAVANGITGRAQPVAPAGGEQTDAGTPPANPRFAAADAALEAGDYARAVEEFDKLLKETPGDAEVIAGRAQAALLQRSLDFDPSAITARAGDTDDLQAQLDAADLEIIQGHYEQGLDRLLQYLATADEDDRETVRLRLLDFFEIIGRTEPVVSKARRRLSSLLF